MRRTWPNTSSTWSRAATCGTSASRTSRRSCWSSYFCGGLYPEATSAPSPKKCRSVCSIRYLRAFGSARLSRFSFTSMVCCLSHCCQASLETFSQMRLPSAPGKGGWSMPSASRPSLTHFTVLAIRRLYAFEKHLRPALPVVERLAPRGQRGDIAGAETLLEEPVGGVRGQRENAPDAQAAGTLLAGLQQILPVARVTVALRHGEAGELGALVLLEGVERRAADDDAVVLDDEEVADLGFEQLAAALHQLAFGLERLDQREHALHVLDARRPQGLDGGRGDHGADAGVREKLEQQRPGRAAGHDMAARNAAAYCAHRMFDGALGRLA